MSRRPILSRPRTRVYNANYDIGQSYYKSALDRLDRKYSGRPLSPPRRNPTMPEDVLERHERAFTDDDLPSARRRAEQLITEDNLFDVRHRRPMSTAFEAEDVDDEISNTLRKFRAKQRAAKFVDDEAFESTVNNVSFNRMINRTDKLLDSVGLNEKTARSIFEREQEPETSSLRRRVLKITAEENGDSRDFSKWTALKDREESSAQSAAAFRARASRARLNDLEDEMEALSERQIARERRAANLRAIIAENAEESEAMDSALKSVHARIEKKSLNY